MSGAPVMLEYEGDGEFRAPSPFWAGRCDKQYVVHERYCVEVLEERSPESHRHLFVCVRNAWLNLPDSLVQKFSTPEKLRKWALIRIGHRDERSFVARSKEEARRLAAFIAPIDEYAEISVEGALVIVFTAKSIARRALPGRGQFQAIKQKVLDLLDELTGVERGTLAREEEAA